MRAGAVAAASAVAALLAACGGESGDLLALEVSGGPQGGTRALVVTEDGRGSCDGGELEPIDNEQLIEARDLEREVTDLADEERGLGGEGRSYRARVREGSVSWSEGAAAKPEPLARLELLALQLSRTLC